MHTLVIGVGEQARRAAREAARDPCRDVTMIRAAGDPSVNTGCTQDDLVLLVRRMADAGVTVELHTYATIIDAAWPAVWVESAGQEEVIAYDELVVYVVVGGSHSVDQAGQGAAST